MGYWEERQAKTQAKLTAKTIKETEEQLKKYYRSSMERIIGQFEQTYNKVLLSIEDGREPTPADLYKLDSYWKMQGQLKNELQKLGDKQAALLSKKFMDEWRNIYESMALKDDTHFGQMDMQAAQQMINQVWCADGKSWSQRVWGNTDKLQQSLNDDLIDCLITGKKPTELRKKLQADFNVGYTRADSIVRTEMTHIQTQAARQRYLDYGISEVEVWADEDERRCDVCGKLHLKRFSIYEKMPIPAHPRCRCCIVPVVEDSEPEPQVEIKEPPKKKVDNSKPIPTPTQQNNNLTLQENNATIQLDIDQQTAQARVEEIQDISILHLNKYDASHTQHAYEITGLPQGTTPRELYQRYEEIATEFFKREIDGVVVDGFIDRDGTLHKFNRETGIYGRLFNNNKFGSIYKLDGDIEKRWEKYKKRFLKEE